MSLNFDEILEKHYDEIFYYVFKQVDCLEDAKDLTQDIFFRVFEKQHQYQPEKASPRTWIYAIAHHVVINHFNLSYQKGKTTLEPWMMDSIASEGDALESLIQKDRVTEILLLMKKILSVRHQHIMNLYFFSELTVGEISSALRIPKQTVSNAIHRSIQKIQNQLRGEINGSL